MTKITFGIVVYQEAELLKRCLESIRDVADEIIVVHDGPCNDTTVEVATSFTNRVYIRDRKQGSDPHRLFILQESANEWIFMIDADEFLSAELKNFLKTATLEATFGAYAFLWPLWNGQKYVTHSNYRPCLFYRPTVWAIGLHNFSLQTTAPIRREPLVLEHQPPYSKVSFARFQGQLGHRLDRDASTYVRGFDALEKFHPELIPESFKVQFASYLAHPLRAAYLNLIRYFIGTYKNMWQDGWAGLVVSTQTALYQYKLAKRIAELKKTV